MDFVEVLDALRSTYITQFEAVYERHGGQDAGIHPEIAFEISGATYKNLYVVDFVKRDTTSQDAGTAIEVSPTSFAYGGNGEFKSHDLQISVGNISWDGVSFYLDTAPVALEGIDAWFDYWIDLDATRQKQDVVVSQILHSVIIEPDQIHVDFGTAPVSALTELLNILHNSGVQNITLRSSREK
ncbi:hypothetical protein EBB79_04390 [Parasedimentitalea marina]|uniref:Uncharacterized protein n=1 Tax=Parasedimentitalea marina TaxID=2483033 RepID=A0A3T0MZL5_9RHOB|nr:hypothetical protein [Parasedimentitalea marina]AZV77201.1 hypothetical protein EBB79_04390 [Parasedimentitalea marina]